MVETRRGAVIYMVNLRQALRRIPTQKDILDAHKRLEGPDLYSLSKPFGGYTDLVEAINKWEIRDDMDLQSFRDNPVYQVVKEILERHKQTKTAQVSRYKGEIATDIDGNYSDSVSFALDDDEYAYRIETAIFDELTIIEIIDKANPTQKMQFMITLNGERAEVVDNTDFEEEPLTPTQELEMAEMFKSVRDKLEASGQLNKRWRDDIELLPTNQAQESVLV